MGTSTGRAALALRLAGATYDEVADILVLQDARAAQALVERALAAEHVDDADRDRLRAEASQRILKLLSGVWGKATDADSPEHLAATGKALQLIDRHARLLGLDAPQEVVVHTPTTMEIDAWVEQMLGSAQVMLVQEADPIVGVLEATDGR